MGKASRTKVESSRREKIAAQRAAARRAEQRKRILLASGAVVVVLAVVLTFVIIKLNNKPTVASASSSPNGPTGSALTSLVNTTTSVPASVLDTVGAGTFNGKVQTITGNPPPLVSNGKPELLFIGAEYCPYCAANRWAMIVALSRFGTFSGLTTVHSGITDGAGDQEPYPNTPTFTFVNAKYTSKYLTFTSVEGETNIPDTSTGGYTALQTPTSAQQALLTKYDAAPYTTRGRGDTVPRLRQQVREHRGQLPQHRHPGTDLEPDRGRPAQPEQHGGQGRRRDRQLLHGGHLQDDGQPAGQRVHPGCSGTREPALRSAQLTGAKVSTAIQSASSP